MTTANQVIKEARKWIGTKQGTAKHKNLVDAYNSISPKPRGYTLKMTDDWCDAFVTVVFDKAGASNLIGREVGVQRHIDIFKSKGIWIEDGKIKPKVGDIITYNWDDSTQPNVGWADHIGIVEKVDTKNITVIEGNISNRVDRRTLEIGHGNIRGYARPKYSSKPAEKSPTKPVDTVIGNFKVGDMITFKGAVFADSYGNKRGSTSASRTAKITRIAAKNPYPVHAGNLGWIKLDQIITKAKPTPEPTPKYTAQSIANDIWTNPKHKWGNQPQREKNIEAVGVSYKAVQDILNKDEGLKIGDAVTFSGYVHRDSYGRGRGLKYTNRVGNITALAGKNIAPIHIDNLGWIKKSQIKGKGGSFKIKTTTPVLNIRSKPSMRGAIVGQINEPPSKKTTYTIVEEKDGWGKLNSNKGWIYLYYTKRL